MTTPHAGPSAGLTHDRDPLFEQTGFRLSWGAIFAGLVVATALQIVFALLGIGIGFSAWDPGESARALGIGALLWWVTATLVALFIGGRTTGRLAGVVTRKDGILHGIVMWGLSTIVGIWLVASGVGSIFGGAVGIASNVVSSTASGVARGAVAAGGSALGNLDQVNWDEFQQEITRTLEQTGDPALAPDSLATAAQQAQSQATQGGATNEQLASDITARIRERAGEVDRQDIVNVLAARTDLSQAEAERTADRVTSAAQGLQAQLGQLTDTLRERAGDVAGAATDQAATGAWFALLGLGLAVAAAAMGAASTALGVGSRGSAATNAEPPAPRRS